MKTFTCIDILSIQLHFYHFQWSYNWFYPWYLFCDFFICLLETLRFGIRIVNKRRSWFWIMTMCFRINNQIIKIKPWQRTQLDVLFDEFYCWNKKWCKSSHRTHEEHGRCEPNVNGSVTGCLPLLIKYWFRRQLREVSVFAQLCATCGWK